MKKSFQGLLHACLFSMLLLLTALPALAEQAKLLVTNAVFFTIVPGQQKPFTGYMLVGADGTILSIAPGAPPTGTTAAATLDAKGEWIIPGFISAHSHLWQSAYRGLAPDKELDGWIDTLYGHHAPQANAQDFYWFTLDGALDHLRHGVTSAYNFNYSGAFHAEPTESTAFDKQQFRAEADSGIRFVHGINIGTIGPQWTTQQAEAQVKAFIAWAKTQPHADHLLRVMINGAGVWSNTEAETTAEATIMHDLHIGDQQHYLEPAADADVEQSKFRWFLDNHMLGPDLYWGHFVHANKWILEESAKAGVGMSWNPLSNGRLASGTPDIPAYMKAGLHIGMGVDGEASADRADPFENMRMGLYQVRARYQNASVLTPYDVLRMQTLGSAEVMGVANKLGSLAPGKYADFLVINPAEFGKVFHPYATLVFVAGVEDIDRIYVGGNLEVLNGKVLHQDVAKVREQAEERAK
ncbi:MAG: amidohydrolase family protein [Acidobacteriaceae bacterium]